MKQVQLFKGRHDLIEEILATIDPGVNDFSNLLVVFPGKRPPHFLRKELARKAGKPVIPPVTYSMDTFIDDLYYNRLNRTSKLFGGLDAVSLLHDLYMSDCPVRLTNDAFGTFDRFLPVGFRLLEALEELYIENISWKNDISAVSPEPMILKHLYKPFYDYLNEKILCTRAVRYREAAEHIAEAGLESFTKIIFAGFFTMTASERMIVKHLLEHPDFFLFLQDGEGIEELINQLKIKPEEKTFPAREPDIYIYQSADAHDEIFLLSRVLSETPKSELVHEKNVIVLPARDHLFPLLRNGLPGFSEDDYNVSLGYPLIRTPVAAFLNIILESVSRRQEERFRASDYLSLLLHPYAKNTKATPEGRTDITRILCHTAEEEFFDKKSRMYFTLEEIENDDPFFEAALKRIRRIDTEITKDVLRALLIKIHDRTLRPFLNINNISSFADQCLDVISYLNDETTAGRHPFFSQFVPHVVQAIETMKGESAGTKSFSDAEAYRRLLHYFLRSGQAAFTGTPVKGLQVLGLLETRNLSFQRAYILDVNEDVLPPAPGTDPFLPQTVRRSLKLPGTDHAQKAALYYFSVLKQNAGELHLFHISNNDAIRSRFIEEYLWQKQKAAGRADGEEQLITCSSGTFRLSRSRPEPIPNSAAYAEMLKTFNFSASMLQTYLACGLQFFYRYILNLYEKETTDESVEALDTGKLVHEILRNFFGIRRNISAEILRSEELDACIDAEFGKYFGAQESGRILLIKNQVRRRLSEFLDQYQTSRPATITGLEDKLSVQFGDYKLNGRFDRIETRGDKIWILDYKTSSGNDIRSALEQFDLNDPDKLAQLIQLAIYWVIYATLKEKSPETIVPAYLFFGDNTFGENSEVRLIRSQPTPAEQYEEYKTKITALLDRITNPEEAFCPPEEKKLRDCCPYCEFSTICGTQWIKKGWG